MTGMSFFDHHKIAIIIAITCCLVLTLFTVPFLKKDYIFDWDQANDYEATAKIAQGKLTLIGPRVTNDQGFFLGPWHYYFLLPFYQVTHGNLYMGFLAALFIQYLFVIVSVVFAKKWFGTLASLSVGLIAATSGTLIEWGFMYVPLLSLLFFFFCLKTIQKPSLLPLLFLFFGFGCTIYTVFYALGLPLTYVVIKLFLEKKVPLKTIALSILFLLLPCTPLFLFDLRHNFLNLKNIFSFFGVQHGPGSQFGYFLVVFARAINFYWLNREISFVAVLASILMLIFGIFLFSKNRLFVAIWLISSLVPMAFYHGNISEYYYAPVVLLIPFFLSGILVKAKLPGKVLLFLLVLLLIGFRIKDKFNNSSGINLSDKIAIVNGLENTGTKYSVSYGLPLGQDSGYNTVFKVLGKNFVADGSSPLYTITYPNNTVSGGQKLFETNKLAVYRR